MDENYLDDLLSDLSDDNGQQNNFDKSMSEDSGIDIDFSDIEDISLDELDELDDIDLSSLELDDIDFDDIDVTKLKSDEVNEPENQPDGEDFDMEALINETDEVQEQEYVFSDDDDFFGDSDDASDDEQPYDEFTEPEEELSPIDEEVFKEAETEQRIDEEMFDMSMDEDDAAVKEEEDLQKSDGGSGADIPNDVENMDLDDLFSALGIDSDNDSQTDEEDYTSNQDEFDDMLSSADGLDFETMELEDIEDIDEKKKDTSKRKKDKKSLSVILFGEPDADDEEEERLLQEKKAKKEESKAQKEVVKAEKKTKNAEKKTLKQKKNQEKKSQKNAEKQKKQAELKAELEAEKNEKKLPNAVVIIVFAVFIAIGALVVIGSKQFDYSQVIKKATNYFERQRYRLAYDEVSGVDVKEKDQELKDRIYTVMYVERLYESYENNMKLNRPDKALDALIRGLEKYDIHYSEAVELGIVEDIDGCKEKIVMALRDTYGISEPEAYEIMALEGQEYYEKLLELTAGMMEEE